jgi:hypothetical protein
MSKRFHGLTSLGWVAIATVIASVAMFRTSSALGIVYLALCAAAPGVIIYAFCAKCPCKAHCAHFFPGRAAMAIDRQPGPYTRAELIVLALALLALIGLPQIWLWRYSGLFVAYWVLNAVAVVQIRRFVCRACDNLFCPLKGQQVL